MCSDIVETRQIVSEIHFLSFTFEILRKTVTFSRRIVLRKLLLRLCRDQHSIQTTVEPRTCFLNASHSSVMLVVSWSAELKASSEKNAYVHRQFIGLARILRIN